VSIVLLTSDLSVSAAAAGAAQRVGMTLHTAFDVQSLWSQVQTEPPHLAIIDLSMPGIDPAEIVTRLRASVAGPVRIVAFGPHVHELKLAAARAAGCDDVFTRGQFHANLGQILASTYNVPPSTIP